VLSQAGSAKCTKGNLELLGHIKIVKFSSAEKTFPVKVGGTADPSTPPDFLLSAMGSTKFMRLSLMKAAHDVIFGAAW
jgi:hypothetical protein